MLKPLEDRVVIEMEKAEETTASTAELNEMLQVLNADSEELSSIATEINNEIAFFH